MRTGKFYDKVSGLYELALFISAAIFIITSEGFAKQDNRDTIQRKQMATEGQPITTEIIRDALLKHGVSLREKITKEIDAARDTKINFTEIFNRNRIHSMEKSCDILFQEFIQYDQNVSNFLVQLSTTTGANLNTQFVFAIYASQLSNQRENIRALLKDLREIISDYRGDVNNRISIGVAFLSFIVSVVAVWLVVWQIRLMNRQDAMMKEQSVIAAKQLEISARQDETNRLLFARKPDLQLLINGFEKNFKVTGQASGGQMQYNLTLSVLNSGDKSITGSYNHVLLPLELQPVSGDSFLGNLSKSDELEISGVKYSHYRNYKNEPVFPTRALEIGNLTLKGPVKTYKILWQIVTEDGVFPSKDNYGEYLLTTQIVTN